MTTKTGITAADVKSSLWGFDFVHPITRETYPDSRIEAMIRSVEDEYERDLSIFFGEKTVVTQPEDGESYDWADDGYAYRKEDFRFDARQGNWHAIRLRRGPIVSVQKMELNFNGLPTGSVFRIPDSWVVIDKSPGRVRVFPPVPWSTGDASSLAVLNAQLYRYAPNVIHVDYTAGISSANLSGTYSDLREAVIRFAGAKVMMDMLPGLAQKATENTRGIAGVSHSKRGGPELWRDLYQQRLRDDQEFRSRFKAQLHGPNFMRLR